MSFESLLDKIRGLPEREVAEVEDFVDFLRSRHPSPPIEAPVKASAADALLASIAVRRARLLRDHGAYSAGALLRELRETGV